MYNNFKILARSLYRNGLYTWINIVGLAISLTAAIFILLWVQDEWSYDKFYKHVDDIYVVYDHSVVNGNERYIEYLPAPFARAIQTELAEVDAATVLGYEWYLNRLDYNDIKYFANHYTDFACVDSSFFHVFDMEFVEGSAQHAFNGPSSIIITDDLAAILFGSESAIGKTLKGNSGGPYQVSAVVKKAPQNSIFQFKALLLFENSPRMQYWYQWSNRSFVKLNPNADPEVVADKVTKVHEKYNNRYKAEYPHVLQPLSKYHLYAANGSETGMKNVRLFIIIAIALLIIACINYINLVTARSRKRIGEIGIRKIAGAGKVQLFFQMIFETVLLLIIAVILAIALQYLLTPYYSMLTSKSLVFSIFDINILLLYLFSFLFIVAVAGIYPAIFISSFNPLQVFKAKASIQKGGISFRRILIVLQFTCSVAFILAVIVINCQQRYMQTKNLGYDRENIFLVDIFSNNDISSHYEAFKNELEQQPGIAGVVSAERNILMVDNFTELRWSGDSPNEILSVATMGVERNFFDLLNLKLKEGNGYSGTSADSLCIFVNEALVKLIGVDDPLNTVVSIPGGRIQGKITGVVEDFHFKHMSEPIGPIVMYLPKSYWMIYVKTEAGKAQEALASTERIWKKYSPDYPFVFEFMDEAFDMIYREDIRTRGLFNAFTIIAIFISCLGLFGLATYTAETRTKEIGIRKTLGASISNIVALLSKEFVALIGIAVVIGIPVAYYFMDKILQDYAYRISITWWMILAAVLAVFILVLITVSAQALRAARANPVKAIKTD